MPSGKTFSGKWALSYAGPVSKLFIGGDDTGLSATASSVGPTSTFLIYATLEGFVGFVAVFQLESNQQFVGVGPCGMTVSGTESCQLAANATLDSAVSFDVIFPGGKGSLGFSNTTVGNGRGVGILTPILSTAWGYFGSGSVAPDANLSVQILTPDLDTITKQGGLPGGDLSWADLSTEDLSGLDFQGTNLSNANLSQATLSQTNLSGANLSGAIFTGTDMRDVKWDTTTTLTGANFSAANLAGMDLGELDFTNAVFSGADLTGTNMSGATLSGASFSGTDLRQTNLGDAVGNRTAPIDFTGAFVDVAALGLDWSSLILVSTNLVGLSPSTPLTGLNAQGAVLSGTDLSQGTFTQPNFGGATLDGTVFQGVTLTGAVFDGATGNGTIFTGVTATGASFQAQASFPSSIFDSADLAGSSFDGANLSQASFLSAELQKATFDQADLTSAQLDGADLTSASFAGASMMRATLTGAVLESANLTGAILGGQDSTDAADLSFAYMANVTLDQANLFGVNAPSVTLFGASVSIASPATMEQVNFSNAYLEGIQISGAVMRGAKLDGACLIGVTLTDVDLSPSGDGSLRSSLTGACLQGAQVEGTTTVADADLTNAGVSFANGSMTTSHCQSNGKASTPWPINFVATAGLTATSMTSETICPNGATFAQNERNGLTIEQMLTSPRAPTKWTPSSCQSLADSQARRSLAARRPPP